MRKIDEIIIHCTSTEAGEDHQAREIDAWHRARKFEGIGYHFLIHLDGFIEPARPIEMVGAHCYGHNANTIGIAYIGGKVTTNGDKCYCDTRTKAQVQAMHELITILIHCYPTIKKVSGHNEYSYKKCPCFDANKEFSIYTSTDTLWETLRKEDNERKKYFDEITKGNE